MDSISISEGNSKLGNVANLNLLPIATCDRCAGCTRPRPGIKGGGKSPQCYAAKAMRMYPSVRKAWSANTRAALRDVKDYFGQLGAWFAERGDVPWFCFHSAGDCPNPGYVRELVAFCRQHPDTRFLVFTKRYAWWNRYRALPTNLSVVYSAWPGLPMRNPHGRAVAWLDDARQPDARVPRDARPCPGSCEGCMVCWGLGTGESVVFHAH